MPRRPDPEEAKATERLQRHTIQLLELASQIPDLNHIEILWNNMKRVVRTECHENMSELQVCTKELSKTPPEQCAVKSTTT